MYAKTKTANLTVTPIPNQELNRFLVDALPMRELKELAEPTNENIKTVLKAHWGSCRGQGLEWKAKCLSSPSFYLGIDEKPTIQGKALYEKIRELISSSEPVEVEEGAPPPVKKDPYIEYITLKAKYKTLFLMQHGDVYLAFHEDAATIGREINKGTSGKNQQLEVAKAELEDVCMTMILANHAIAYLKEDETDQILTPANLVKYLKEVRTDLGGSYLPKNAKVVPIQIRAEGTDAGIVNEFKQAMRKGDWNWGASQLPIAYLDATNGEETYYLPDGIKRWEAFQSLGLPSEFFPVQLCVGTRREAELRSYKVNAHFHAQTRSSDTLRKVALLALIAPEWKDKSQNQIANEVCVAAPTLSKYLNLFLAEGSEELHERLIGRSLTDEELECLQVRKSGGTAIKYTTSSGQTKTIKTTGLRKKSSGGSGSSSKPTNPTLVPIKEPPTISGRSCVLCSHYELDIDGTPQCSISKLEIPGGQEGKHASGCMTYLPEGTRFVGETTRSANGRLVEQQNAEVAKTPSNVVQFRTTNLPEVAGPELSIQEAMQQIAELHDYYALDPDPFGTEVIEKLGDILRRAGFDSACSF